jgi:diamine N-acetyltransferase
MSATLKNNEVFLRLPVPGDFEKIFTWENNPENWRVSYTTKPFTQAEIRNFVNTPQDIFSTGQLRLIICKTGSKEAIGAVDLFEYDGIKQTAGVGILVEETGRGKGYGLNALELLADYSLNELGIRTLFATVLEDNPASIKLFEKAGFKKTGVRKSEMTANGKWLDLYCYRLDLVAK